MENLIKDLEELASHLPWGTLDRGKTPMTSSGNRLPYGIETIAMAISELKKYEELKKKISDGRLVELPCNCKIGDLVYGVTDYLSKPKLGILTCVEITKYCIRYGIVDKRLMLHDVEYVYPTDKKEEAEAKLAELKGE